MADLLFNQVANPIIASFTLTGVSLTYDSAAKKTKFTSNSIDIASIGTASTAAFVRYAYCFRVGGTVLVDPIAFMLDLDAALAATVGITLYGDRLISAPGNNGWLRFGQ